MPRIDALTAPGTIPAAAQPYIRVTELGHGNYHRTVLTLTNLPMVITDQGTGHVGYGSAQLYDFPAGAIDTIGCIADLVLTAGAGGLADAFDGDFGIGTVAQGADDDLTSTDQDILPKTATAQAVAGVGAAKGQSTAAEDTVKDGTTTAKDAFLNVIFDDADISAADTLAVSGTITMVWINLGDY